MQQFNSLLLDENFQSLLRAIIYALDNPIGSLSITFEAMQVCIAEYNVIGSKHYVKLNILCNDVSNLITM